jgi:hypothetical protein
MMSVLVGASLLCGALSNALTGAVAQQSAELLFVGTGILRLSIMAGFGLSRSVRMIR